MRISFIPCKGLSEREQVKLLVNEGRLDVRVQYVVGIEPFCGIARRSGGRKFDVKVFMYESKTYVWLIENQLQDTGDRGVYGDALL